MKILGIELGKSPIAQEFAPFYRTVEVGRDLNCIDPRPSDGLPNTNKFPGATASALDTLKVELQIDENTARGIVEKSGLPIVLHVDEYHGNKGCFYNRMVEEGPAVVLAPEPIPAEERITWAQEQPRGKVLVHRGDHLTAQTALINNDPHKTYDTRQALLNGKVAFNFDLGAAREIAKKLPVNPKRFADHLGNVYEATVKAAGIDKVQKI